MKAKKNDHDKDRWDLLPLEIEYVVKVLTRGAKKYADWNWQKVVKANPERYEAALLRHYIAHKKGEKLDPETKLPHLAHLICCALFLMWNDKTAYLIKYDSAKNKPIPIL